MQQLENSVEGEERKWQQKLQASQLELEQVSLQKIMRNCLALNGFMKHQHSVWIIILLLIAWGYLGITLSVYPHTL